MDQAQKLRDLASWYREFVERAENPAIWDARLRTAEDFKREAGNLEPAASGPSTERRNSALAARSDRVRSGLRRRPCGEGWTITWEAGARWPMAACGRMVW